MIKSSCLEYLFTPKTRTINVKLIDRVLVVSSKEKNNFLNIPMNKNQTKPNSHNLKDHFGAM